MAKINILTKSVYNKIAAGEVIERPYSVVKELVENGIDSGATEIEIYIERSGKELIKVVDNGCGIAKDDLFNALLPHATSKIISADDLFSISTLGFRGEALASISAVSHTTICSKTADSEYAFKIECNGGEASAVAQCAGYNGTIVTVSNLFYNTPVRAKFMKSERGEEADISTVVARFVLGNPSICFKYFVDGKCQLQSYGGGEEEALACVYGAKILDNCYKIETIKNGIAIRGYIGKPSFSKPNKSYQLVFLNNRFIVNNTISSAVANAYSSYLMKRQYPFYALKIDILPEFVDVNVHPNKSDVRFQNNQVVYASVYSVVSAVLDGRASALDIIVDGMPEVKAQQMEILPPADASTEAAREKQAISSDELPKTTSIKTFLSFEDAARAFREPTKPSIVAQVDYKQVPFAEKISVAFNDSGRTESVYSAERAFAENKRELEKLDSEKPVWDVIDLDNYVYKGSLFNTYLIYEIKEEVFLIDQHAAHERLLFDKFTEAVKNRCVDVQTMLVPYVLELNSNESAFLSDKLDALKEIGFDIEAFGGNSFKISAVPIDLMELDLKAFFDEILGDLSCIRGIRLHELIRDRLAMTACKHAVKGGNILSESEIDSLFKMLNGNFGLKCPHGRPVAIKITKQQIEKLFKRIV